MTRKLKVFGLAVVAVLAMSAVAASAASATYSFTAPEGPVFATGAQTTVNVFTTGAGTVECTTANFKGTQSAASSSDVTITPEYSGCTAFSIATTDVKMNGCTYTFTTPTVEKSATEFEGVPPHIVCPAGSQIEITPTSIFGSICTVKIAAQTPTGGNIKYVNGPGNGTTTRDTTVTAAVTGIHYTSTGGLCGASGTNGTYSGAVTLKGYKDGSAHTEANRTAILVK